MVMKRKGTANLLVFLAFMALALGGLYIAFDQSVAPIADEAAVRKGNVPEARDAAEDNKAQAVIVPQTRVISGVEYAVNENGMSFGPSGEAEEAYVSALDESGGHLSREEALAFFPDLVAVMNNDGTQGYVTADDYYNYFSGIANVKGIEQTTGEIVPSFIGTEQKYKLYDVDGTTVLGEWPTYGEANKEVYIDENGAEVQEVIYGNQRD